VFRRVKIGIVGCGRVIERYEPMLQRARMLDIASCADLDEARARAVADVFGARALAPDQLITSDVAIVLNLTPPAAHAEVARAALEAGKHVYSEKPLAITREDGRALVELARAKGVRLGCAPDTFLGPAWQTARALVDEGAIGEPVAARATMLSRGHEHWHSDPAFFYRPGGGPLLDMGPYYLTVLVMVLGPVRRVTAAARASFPERTISYPARAGERIAVGTPTHVTGSLEFASGVLATITTSFDVYAIEHAIDLFGSDGSMLLDDPNEFDGAVRVARAWEEPRSHIATWSVPGRGVGLADFVDAITDGRPHRASDALAFHVLDVMLALLESADRGARVEIESTCARPEPLRAGEVDAWLAR
jgi:predicted dehydrogenase